MPVNLAELGQGLVNFLATTGRVGKTLLGLDRWRPDADYPADRDHSDGLSLVALALYLAHARLPVA